MTRQSNGNGRWAFQALGGLGSAIVIAAACAGGDTPQRTRSLEAEVIRVYDPDFATGSAGNASMAGRGGSASGQGGSASTNAGSGGSGTSAAGSGNMAGSGNGDVCNAPVEVLQPSCGALGSACHGAGSGLGDFGDGEAAALALLDEPSNCGGLPYFDTADPENSAVVAKLGDAADVPCGSPMPIGTPLTPDEIECIIEWVAAQN